MRNIVVVEAISTGYNFVDDIVKRGYNPIVLQDYRFTDLVKEERRDSYSRFHHQPEIIQALEDYDKTLELVRSYDPLLVIPGGEDGVVLATRLADDLGLPGNPYSNIDAMTKKSGMHESLRKAGIRYIRGKVVSTPDEAVSFCVENGLKTAVIKPLRSAASQGLFLCDNLDEVRTAAETIITWTDIFGCPIDSFLVQERIYGEEYIVNTISCNGTHRFNSMMRYTKVQTDEGGYIYDSIEVVSKLEPGHTALIEYAYKVADAIGIKYGVVHGEYMIDDNGPVLIEVNCRPMGCSMSDEYLDLIYGQHESDAALDSYLDPEGFAIAAEKPYKPLRKGVLKLIMVPHDLEAEDNPILTVAKQLRSTYRVSAQSGTPVQYIKTRDLESAGGIVYMVHDDENVVNSDLALLKKIEKSFFSLLLNDGMSRRWFTDSGTEETDPSVIMKDCGCHGSTLLVSDKERSIEGIRCAVKDDIDDVYKGYDNVIISLRDSLLSLKESECLDLIFRIMDKVKPGGRVIIPGSTYDYMSYQREGAEMLMEIKGLEICAPTASLHDYVIGYASLNK